MDHKLHVIGTAGHVDHGKSTLVEALTGIDPDRLAEEKAREMTIDLGFAWLTIGDEEIGIVDVPGHRDFIENMLAGIGGIDLALFVIAADEGVMPQTREHLAILDLLQIEDGIVALSKTDLVDDPEWLELITLDISETLAGTSLEDAPIVPVSAHSGVGLEDLKSLLAERLASKGARPDNGRPRLAVDRVFTLTGFGTVVTGTLTGGSLNIGDQVEIVPGQRKARIRGLQTHKRKLETAYPGSRVAINLTGVDRKEIDRGQVVAGPGVIGDTRLIDVHYRHLPASSQPLKHNMQVKLFVGAAEVVARTRVIGNKIIEPGQEGWLQLALSEPVAVARGDRFILRRPSPTTTLGGGRVLDPHPGRHHRRFHPQAIERLQTLEEGSPKELITLTLDRIQPATKMALIEQSGLDNEAAEMGLSDLLEKQQVRSIEGYLINEDGWRKLRNQGIEALNDYHRTNPYRLGMPREELRSRLRAPLVIFNALVAETIAEGAIVDEGNLLKLGSHDIVFSTSQESQINALLDRFRQAGASTPSVKETRQAIGDDLYLALVDLKRLIPLNNEVVYESGQYKQISEQILDYIQDKGQINAADARDLLGTSRKYAIALLEHLDDNKVTRRVGDVRVLG